MPDFSVVVNNEIRQRLLSGDKAKISQAGDLISGIVCPACGKPEAWAHYHKPLVVFCNRENNCRYKGYTRQLYPDLFVDYERRFPATAQDPKATARAYLQARGLNTDKFEFHQGIVDSQATVSFKFDDIVYQRIIDYTGNGSGKNRITAYQGKLYRSSLFSKLINEDPKNIKEVWIVGGVIEAESLALAGKCSISTLSEGHIPKKSLIEISEKLKGFKHRWIIAYDNDIAGHHGAKKLRQFFNQQGIPEVYFAFTKVGLDWNNLLQQERLILEEVKKSLWRGKLFESPNERQWFKTYYLYKRPRRALYFHWNGETFTGYAKWYEKGKVKPDDVMRTANDSEDDDIIEGHEITFHVNRISNFTMRILFTELITDPMEGQIARHHVEAEQVRGEITESQRIRIDASTIGSASLKPIFNNHSLSLYGTATQQMEWFEAMIKQSPPKIRQVLNIGHDPMSDAFVYADRLYNKGGRCEIVSNEDYFTGAQLKGIKSNKIMIPAVNGEYNGVNIKYLVELLQMAYGYRAMLGLGFYVATALSDVIFNRYKFFPFMSFYGATHSGKTFLTTRLNQCFFRRDEGESIGKNVTYRSLIRTFALYSGMVIPIIEGQGASVNLLFEELLKLYNRGDAYKAAKKTTDLQTTEFPFQAALLFVQNKIPFKDRPALERVILVPFDNSDLNETLPFYNELRAMEDEQFSIVGDWVMRHRSILKKEILREILLCEKSLFDAGVGVGRIVENYAIAIGAIKLFCRHHAVELKDDFDTAIFKAAINSEKEAKTLNDIADGFLDQIKEFPEYHGVKKDSVRKQMYVNVALANKQLKESGYAVRPDDMVRQALREHELYANKSKQKKMAGRNLNVLIFNDPTAYFKEDIEDELRALELRES